MEEILSSIKRIIAEDKEIEISKPEKHSKASVQPALQAVPDLPALDDGDEILELTEEVVEEPASSAQGVFGDRRKEERLINDDKLNSMRQSLSALVAMEGTDSPGPAKQLDGTSLEDLTRDMMRPMLKKWLDENLPALVEELVAREIQRISQK